MSSVREWDAVKAPSLTRIIPALALGLLFPLSASALIIASEAANDTPPIDDPGFANVGRLSELSGAYLGYGWVITVRHVGLHDVTFGAVTHPRVPGSEVIIEHDASSHADLRLYQVDPWPDLPPLTIRSDPIPDPDTTMTDVIMVGNGWAVGVAVVDQPGPGNDCATRLFSPCGFFWNSTGAPFKTIRWGTNRILTLAPDFTFTRNPYTTESFVTRFDRNLPTPHEAQVTYGDSGGAVFIKNDGRWELAGILHAREEEVSQPARSAIYGNRSFAADLSFYRDQIVPIVYPTCFPDCGPCNNSVDDDGDGLIDNRGDPGCRNPDWHTESPECDDGIDNDGDGAIDTLDATCGNAWQISEAPTSGCGTRAELALVLPLLLLLRRWLRR
jgi:hypothetical protein